ncbi:MAB_1171c family putative transporter [Streptomyces sp. NPDC059455]|uniref:MAB_1171c family putative transporter n=1 Tax=Streptomyces sp. NPDC059455 TaxID=3346837 RepID=UPI0036C26A46
MLRSPAALRATPLRAVWLAVATAAGAMTLDLPSVIAAATRHSEANAVTVTRNVLGVLSAGAVLYFVAQATAVARRLKTALVVAVCSVLVILLSLDLAAVPHLRIVVPATGTPAPSQFYWLVLISTHLTSNALCVLLCLRHSAASGSRSLIMSLRLFGIGTGLVGVYWLGYLVRVTTGGRWPLPWLSLLMDLHGALRAMAVLVPTVSPLRTALSNIAVAWRLWPMWNDLVTAVPHVALARPRHRIWDVVWPRLPYSMLSYRRIIETRDAILALTDYVAPTHPPSSPGAPPRYHSVADMNAEALAYLIKDARNAKFHGSAPTPRTVSLSSSDSRNLTDEADFLLRMAKAYRAASSRVDADRQ